MHPEPGVLLFVMKSVLSHFPVRWLVLFLAFSSGTLLSGRAEESWEKLEHPLKPLLWKIGGNGLTAPSWLFGTIHVGTGPLGTLHPAAQAAFDEAAILYTEIRMDPSIQMAMVPKMMRQDGKTLADSIGPEMASQLDAELKRISPAMDAKPFQSFKTWTLALTLPMLPGQLKGEKAMDQILWEKAKATGKKTSGLERSADQLEVFDHFNEAEQVRLLGATLEMMREDRDRGKDSMTEMIEAYVSGEPERLVEVLDRGTEAMTRMGEKELGDRFTKKLLTDRDVTMAATIARHLNKEPGRVNFFAVGAGHLCPAISIRSHLEKAGFTLTRIGRE